MSKTKMRQRQGGNLCINLLSVLGMRARCRGRERENDETDKDMGGHFD